MTTTKTISSSLTFFYKFIVSGIMAWIIIGISIWQPDVIVIIIPFAIYTYFIFIRLKKVSTDNSFLRISNFIKEITVPVDLIISVKGSTFIAPSQIIIKIKERSEFGDTIVFTPKSGIANHIIFGEHPIIKELRRISGLQNHNN